MKYAIKEIDSKVFGFNVIEISSYSVKNLQKDLSELIQKLSPCYIFVEIDSSNLKTIHSFEEMGFKFSEFRVNAIINTDNFNFNTSSLFPYVIRPIVILEDLELIKKHLQENILDDRFSLDYSIPKVNSFSRNYENILKSKDTRNEFLLGVYNTYTKELQSFVSGKRLNKLEALYFQQGVLSISNFDNNKDILNLLTINYLKEEGVNLINVNITGNNITELNLFINKYKFHINTSTVFLRKFSPHFKPCQGL